MTTRIRFSLMIALAFLCISLFVVFQRHPQKVDIFYEKYRHHLQSVADYFSSFDGMDLTVNADGTYTVRAVAADNLTIQRETFSIADDTVKASVRQLFWQAQVKSIHKSGDTVIFLRWTRLMDFGSGFAYAASGEVSSDIDYLTHAAAMPDTGWYYYESDYNKWRLSC